MPNLKVLLITVLGSFLAINRLNILSTSAIDSMNTMVYFVFSPALACSSLASTITLKSLIALWFMPFCIVVTVIVGTALGWLLVKITRVPYHLRGLVLGCCAVGNIGNLPLMVVSAICKEKSNPFGDEHSCHENGMAYASLSLALASILVWSFAYNIVRIYSNKEVSSVDKVVELKENPTLASESDPKTMSNANNSVDQHEIETYILPNDGYPIQYCGEEEVNAIPKDNISSYVDWSGLKGEGVKFSLIFGIIVVRNIVLPVLGVATVKGAIHLGLIHHDPLYEFVLLLQFALPPAVAISTSAQLFGSGKGECSIIMLATYSFAAVSLTLWWFMPVSIFVTYIAGTLLGWLLIKTVSVPPHLHGLVLGCCAAGNLASLPLTVVPTICKEENNPFGDEAICHRNGLAFASLSMAVGYTYAWSFTFNIVRIYSPKISNVVKVDESTVNPKSAIESDPENLLKSSCGELIMNGGDTAKPNGGMDQPEFECKVPNGQAKVPGKLKFMKQLKLLAEKINNMKILIAPSTMAAVYIMGVTIGIVPQFRKLLVGDNALLHVVQDTLTMLG
ncbi:unnamed protein product [Sphenostylis stenocarpa]|uniref:Protein PIN-LIKES 3 n=1 Tax=Sphenostylis stenocarpa TaxID=92480 RepID=A0AA86VIE4_9FABA|nr:unnamed protein product [Sphenostylis stenocarpa]